MRNRRLWGCVALLTIVVGGTGCTGAKDGAAPSPSATQSDFGDPWATLRTRPLTLPTSAAAACKNAHTKRVSGYFAPALQPVSGPAIVMPVGFTSDGRLDWVFNRKTDWKIWGGQKVLWVISPSYKGPALIRGHQLDGRTEVRFEGGAFPSDSLKLGPGGGTTSDPWREFPSYTRLRASGCFAYQVDGDGFSEIIVFKAVRAPDVT